VDELVRLLAEERVVEVRDVSPYVAREMARLYPKRWSYDAARHELTIETLPPAAQSLQDLRHATPNVGDQGGAAMSRATYQQVTFRRSFVLSGLEGRQPAGTYTVETVEALHETLSALVYRRIATLIHVHSAPGVKQSFPISQDELDHALAMDLA
jgi:hypothetical protein